MSAVLHFVGYARAADADPDQTERVRSGLVALCAAVDGVDLLAIGPNSSPSAFAKNWDYAAVVSLRDASALSDYLAHPLHAALGAETRNGFYDQCIVVDVPCVPTTQGDPS